RPAGGVEADDPRLQRADRDQGGGALGPRAERGGGRATRGRGCPIHQPIDRRLGVDRGAAAGAGSAPGRAAAARAPRADGGAHGGAGGGPGGGCAVPGGGGGGAPDGAAAPDRGATRLAAGPTVPTRPSTGSVQTPCDGPHPIASRPSDPPSNQTVPST